MARRNLARHGRRSILTCASVAAQAAAIVFFMGYYRGTYDEMFYGAIIDYQTAHAQIQAAGLDPDDPAGWVRPRALMTGWRPAAAAARAAPKVVGAAPRLEMPCLAGDGAEKAPALLAGVDFEEEPKVSVFAARVAKGRLPSASGEVLVGDGLAELFAWEPGSTIVVQAGTSHGTPNIARFSVAGIFDSGFGSFDSSFLAISLPDAQELADAPGAANRVYVKLSSAEALDRAMPAIAAAASGIGAIARPWTFYASEAIDHASTETVFYYVFLAVLVAVSASAIASTMRMAAFERVREVAAMRATGWTRADVFLLFAMESAAIGIAGSAAGAAVGGAASAILHIFPVDARAMSAAIDYPFFSMTSSSQPGDFLVGTLVGSVAALVAGVAPARKAARTNIVQALSTH